MLVDEHESEPDEVPDDDDVVAENDDELFMFNSDNCDFSSASTCATSLSSSNGSLVSNFCTLSLFKNVSTLSPRLRNIMLRTKCCEMGAILDSNSSRRCISFLCTRVTRSLNVLANFNLKINVKNY